MKMKRRIFCVLWFALVFVLVNTSFAENIILLGWDGTGRKEINTLLARGKLVNLQRLHSEGWALVELENTTVTATIPGWTQVFTGLTYDQSGVFSNVEFQGPLSFSTTLPGRLKKALGMKVGWFASKIYWSDDFTVTPLSQIARKANTYKISLPKNGQAYIDKLLREMLRFINQNTETPFFAAMLCNPDYYGHLFGSNGARYFTEIERSDNVLGVIVDELKKLGIYENTKIVVVSDHGFDVNARTHSNAPDSFMFSNLPIQRRGTLRDVPVTILDHFAIAPKPRPHLRGTSLLLPENLWREE